MNLRPALILGFPSNSYEAYCIDEAVMVFGTQLQSKLEEAGHKPSKEERRAVTARQRIIDKVFGKEKSDQGYADPMNYI